MTDFERTISCMTICPQGVNCLEEDTPSIHKYKQFFSQLKETLRRPDAYAVIESDMKIYDESGVKFAIGQVEVMNLEEVRDIKDDYLEALETVRETKALDWCMLLITDVIKEESILLATEFEKESRLVYDRIEKGCYSLPGVLSRKKQLLPEILRVLSEK